MIFGRKTRKVVRFGAKVARAGLFGLKNGGRMAYLMGTLTGNPSMMAQGAGVMALSQGIEKML